MPEKKTKVKSGLKHVVILPRYFHYIFVDLRQKGRLGPKLIGNFVNFMPEPDPKSLARLTTLFRFTPLFLFDCKISAVIDCTVSLFKLTFLTFLKSNKIWWFSFNFNEKLLSDCNQI